MLAEQISECVIPKTNAVNINKRFAVERGLGCVGTCVTTGSLGNQRVVIDSICVCSWRKSPAMSDFNAMSLNVELGSSNTSISTLLIQQHK